jgi:hypothetical protein
MWFNVGGVVFETRASTLERHTSYFTEFASCDESSTIFIDRDPTHFRHVLNFLRGSFTYPPSRLQIQELINEATFYALDGLVSQLSGRLSRAEHDLSYHLMILSSRLS